MSTPGPLPDAALLEKLLLGQLPPAEAEALCEQLQDNQHFAALAQTLHASDTLIEALRSQPSHPPPPPDARLEGLMARLSKLRPDLSGTNAEATAALGTAESVPLPSPAQQPDELGRLGDYRLLKVLGQGGMGIVFLAEDLRLARRVALKTMRPEAAQMAHARERFLREARGTAAIEHDHIIPIFQVGEENGVPFLAMPLLRGEALDERLKRAGDQPLPVREVVRIGREVAEGLAAAHEQGLIHRDIKPANVWLEGERGRVKVLDFGLARAVREDTHLTQSGAILGTPAYMAPEQARGEAVDARCDLFSLGCLLYQMATGRKPFNGPDTMSILMSLALDQPAPPRQHNAELPAELSDLIARLLAKKPDDRPASARAVADALAAIERGLSDDTMVSPLLAPSPARSRRRLHVAVAAAMLLLGGLTALTVVIIRDRTGKEVARFPVPDGGSVVVQPGDKPNVPDKEKRPAAAILADPLPKIERGTPLGPLALVTNPAPLPGVRSWTIETRTPRGGIAAVAYQPKGQMLATAGDDGVVRLVDSTTGRLLRALVGHATAVTQLAWSPDGHTLASGSYLSGDVRLWDAESGRQLRTLSGLPGVGFLVWLPDGRTIAALYQDHLRAWNAVNGEIVRNLTVNGTYLRALSPDGKRVAGTLSGGKVRICDSESGEEVRTLPDSHEGLEYLCWSPDGRLLAAAGPDNTVRLWQLETGKKLWSVKTSNVCRQMAWSPDGKTLAVNNDPSRLEFIRVESGKVLTTQPINGHIGGMAWSSDGDYFAVGSGTGSLLLTRGTNGGFSTIPGVKEASFLTSLAWSPDSKQLAASTYGTGLRVVNPASGEMTASLTDGGRLVAWSPSKWLAVASEQITLWQPGSGQRLMPRPKKSGTVRALAWSPDGKTLAVDASVKTIRLWDTTTRQIQREWDSGGFADELSWSPDGKLLAASVGGQVKLWQADTGKEMRTVPTFNGVAWSPLGETLALFNGNGVNVRLFNVKTGELGITLPSGGVQNIAWSPDGKRLAAACTGDAGQGGPLFIPVWDVTRGEEVRKLDRVCLRGQNNPLMWSPNGKRIAAGYGQTIQLWDAETGKSEGVILPNPHFHGLTIRPDGRYRGDARVDEGIVMVAQKEDGSIETLPPAEFARKYKWKNEP